MPLRREGTLPVGFERIKRNNNDNVPRKRDTERERQECIYSLPLAYTNKIRERSLSLSRLQNQCSQTHPALFYNRPVYSFCRFEAYTRANHPPFTPSPLHARTVRALLRASTPLLRPSISPSPLSPRHRSSHFLNLPRVRAVSPRIQLG